MNRGSKRQVRDTNQDQAPRRRVEGIARAATDAVQASAELISEDEKSYTTKSTSDVDEFEYEPEEGEIIEEGDEDDEYVEFRKESDAALVNDFASVRIAPVDDDDEDPDAAEVAVWRHDKGDTLEGGTKLEYENKAYDTFFQLCTEYPCLSFDIVCDGDGANRTKYPLSMLLVCGTQADEASKNQLVLLKAGNICRTKHDVLSDAESEVSYIGDAGESDDDADADDREPASHAGVEELNNGEPTVHHRGVPHHGTVNRLRCCPALFPPTSSSSSLVGGGALVAAWSDAGHVQVFDLDSEARALVDFANWSKERATATGGETRGGGRCLRFCTPSSAHKVEGFGLGWSPVRAHAFASGDCAGTLNVWHPTDDGRWRRAASHTAAGAASVEEIRWSPTQAEVLITARAGGDVEVWDVRDMRQCKLRWRADPTDINVADWNQARQASHLLVTGADSGAVAIWDLRKLSSVEPIQSLPWHTKSITSVEFSLHNESVLAVTADDGQCTLWDLSLERDPSEEQGAIGDLFGRKDLTDIPDQLMFQHQGLTHPKEVHWHPQIPGMVIVTDYEGLHLFKPMNWRSLMK